MKKIFVTYGNEQYYTSLSRIKKEAESLLFFDEIRVYTDKDLPQEITKHSLFQYNRGGGYWIWKPWVILDSLKKMNDDDILVYADAGCQLFQDKEWNKWWSLLKEYNGIFFSYGGTMEQFTKKSLLAYFANENLKYYYQLQSGLIIFGKRSIPVCEEWLDTMLRFPELVVDTTEEERKNESRKYVEHRHDQAILSGIVYRNERKLQLKVEWQRLESRYKSGQAVYAARISNEQYRLGLPQYEKFYISVVKDIFIMPYRRLRMKWLRFRNQKWSD